MIVYINGRFRQQPLTGIQRYASQIVLALDALVAEGATAVTCRLLLPPGAPRLPLRAIEQVEHGRLHGHLWEQVEFGRAARDGVALSLAASGPFRHPAHVAVIHDAAIYRLPGNYARRYVLLHRLIDRALAQSATIATVSDFSRGELVRWLKLDAARIVVAPNSAEHLVTAADERIFAKLGLAADRPFFVTLGSQTHSKNLQLPVTAMAAMPATAQLVMVGQVDPGVYALRAAQPPRQVILAGRLSDHEIVALLRRARALIFPSLYEGFGIPPLEAFGNDCPVLASDIAPIREVCGDAAAYFDPHDRDALIALMRTALADTGDWRAERIARGRERVEHFSWTRSAATLLAACADAAARTGRA
ncbi:glycosyltransferase family 4 protein [Sphingomonas citri]